MSLNKYKIKFYKFIIKIIIYPLIIIKINKLLHINIIIHIQLFLEIIFK